MSLRPLQIAQIKAKEIGGIVYKPNKYVFEVSKSFWSLAMKVAKECRDPKVCFYEIVSQEQCIYVDLDLKRKDCQCFPRDVQKYSIEMVREFLHLLQWGFDMYLKLPFDLNHVIIGDSSAAEKISFHVSVYDQVHA